jgi:hypothetical protein
VPNLIARAGGWEREADSAIKADLRTRFSELEKKQGSDARQQKEEAERRQEAWNAKTNDAVAKALSPTADAEILLIPKSFVTLVIQFIPVLTKVPAADRPSRGGHRSSFLAQGAASRDRRHAH